MDRIITDQNQTLMTFYVLQPFTAAQGLTIIVSTGSGSTEVPSYPVPRDLAWPLCV
jgi:hypothetical protein